MKKPESQNAQNRQIDLRISQAFEGRRDALRDYETACSAVKRTHNAFKASADKKGCHSSASADGYARALNELEICVKVLSRVNPDSFKRSA